MYHILKVGIPDVVVNISYAVIIILDALAKQYNTAKQSYFMRKGRGWWELTDVIDGDRLELPTLVIFKINDS